MKLKKLLAFAALAIAALPSFGQDLLASKAPVDRRMRSLDSLTLRRMLPEVISTQDPSSSLYPEWNNNRGRNYGVALPKEYKIDLRHFCMPCDSRLVTSHFGYRAAFGRNHYGTDIKLYVGDTVRSAFAGKIRIVAYEGKGYGNYVIIRHENGLETVYGHLSKHLVKENQIVRAGEPIGLGGNTGRSTGSHLHFETRFLGQYIDPEILFNFSAHDVKGDYYVYRENGKHNLMGDVHHAELPYASYTPNRPVATPSPAKADRAQATPERPAAQAEQPTTSAKKAKTSDQASAATSTKAADQASAKSAAKAKEKADKKKKEQAAARRNHTVKQGESLYSIARQHGTTVEKLCKINHISETATIRPGQVIRCS